MGEHAHSNLNTSDKHKTRYVRFFETVRSYLPMVACINTFHSSWGGFHMFYAKGDVEDKALRPCQDIDIPHEVLNFEARKDQWNSGS